MLEGVEHMSDEINTDQQFNAQVVPEFTLPELVVTAPRLTWNDIFGTIVDTILDPQNPVFIDPTLSYQDIMNGYQVEENPLGIGLSWRVNAAGIPHPDDAWKLCEQQKIVQAYSDILYAKLITIPGSSEKEFRFDEVVVLGDRSTSDASGAKNNDLIHGFKQVVKDAIANGILPNPATMQSDYKFIEGGLSTPILKLASVAGGFIMDKKGNVYLIIDGSVGYGLGLPLPVTGSVGQGYFGNAEKSDAQAYKGALEGGAIGTTTGAGIQGNVSIGVPSGVISGEVSLNPSIGKTFGGRYTVYLFNIND